MKKPALAICFLTLVIFAGFAQSELNLNLTLSVFGVPGLQVEARVAGFGLAVSAGVPSSVYVCAPSDLLTLATFFTFGIEVARYIIEGEDSLFLYGNIGSINTELWLGEDDRVEYTGSSAYVGAGLGVATKLWDHLNLKIKLGAGYAFPPYREYGVKPLEEEDPRLGLLFEVGLGYSIATR